MLANEIRTTWYTLRLWGGFSYRIDRRVPFVALMLVLFTLSVLIFSISYGEYDISPFEVVQTLTHNLDEAHPKYRQFNLVVFTFRLPRIWVAFMAGAALATSGAIMQGITRNPLADPYLLGVSGGAGLAAVSIIVLFQDVPMRHLPWYAFGGALIVAFLIYGLAWKGGSSTPMRLILIGVAIASIVSAITTMILVTGRINQVQQAYVWLSGSVYGRTWQHVHLLAGWLVVLLPIAFLSARWLNILNMGDETAKGLGMRVERQRSILLILSVALAAGAVAMSGTIGFVGLVAPHVTRRLVGPSHEGLLPISALFGGALLVTADLIGRWVIAPSEIPIGIVTAMIGAPYFLYLLYRGRND
jgi:iron complex transport system permease protein